MFDSFPSASKSTSTTPAHYLNNAGNHLYNAGGHLVDASVAAVKTSFFGSIIYAGGWLVTTALCTSASPVASFVFASEGSTSGLAIGAVASNSSIVQGALGLAVGTKTIDLVAAPFVENSVDTIYHTGSAIAEVLYAGYDVLQAVEAGVEYVGEVVVGSASHLVDYVSA